MHALWLRHSSESVHRPAAGRYAAGERRTGGSACRPSGRSPGRSSGRAGPGSTVDGHRRTEHVQRVRFGIDQRRDRASQCQRGRHLAHAGHFAPVHRPGPRAAHLGLDGSVTGHRCAEQRRGQRDSACHRAGVGKLERNHAGTHVGTVRRGGTRRLGDGTRSVHAQRHGRSVERRQVIGRLPDLGG